MFAETSNMLSVILISIGAALSAVYYVLLRSASYWRRRGIPYVPGPLFWGSCYDLFRIENPRVLQYREWSKIYGKTYGIKEGAFNTLVTSDLEMIQEIHIKQFQNFHARKRTAFGPSSKKSSNQTVLNSKGETWKRLRHISSPSFTTGSLKRITTTVEDSALELIRVIESRHGDGTPFNIHEFYQEYSMDNISKLVMGQKGSLFFENPRIDTVKKLTMRNFDSFFVYIIHALPFLRPLADRLCSYAPLNKPFVELQNEIRRVVKKRIAEGNDTEDGEAQDFIDFFLEFAVDRLEDANNNDDGDTVKYKSKYLSVDEVIAQAIVFLIAGFDTTSNTLGFATWVLANNPDVQKRIQEEIDDSAFGENVSYDELMNLPYLDAVCRESLRVYPTGTFVNSRTCTQTTEVCGVKIEEGTGIQIDVVSLHLDKDIWGDDAEEWLDPARRVIPSAFLSFGIGPRFCIGTRLAMLVEKMALVQLLRRYSVVKAEPDAQLRMKGSLGLTPVNVKITIEPRC